MRVIRQILLASFLFCLLLAAEKCVSSPVLSKSVAGELLDAHRHDQPVMLVMYKQGNCIKCELDLARTFVKLRNARPEVFCAVIVVADRVIEAKKMIQDLRKNITNTAFIPDNGDLAESCNMLDIETTWAYFTRDDSLVAFGKLSDGISDRIFSETSSDGKSTAVPRLILEESIAIKEDTNSILTSVFSNSSIRNDQLAIADKATNRGYLIDLKNGEIIETITITNDFLSDILGQGESFLSDAVLLNLGARISVQQVLFTSDEDQCLVYGTVYVKKKEYDPERDTVIGVYKRPFLLRWSRERHHPVSFVSIPFDLNPSSCQDALLLGDTLFLGQDYLSMDKTNQKVQYDSLFTALVLNLSSETKHYEFLIEPFYRSCDFASNYAATSFALLHGNVFMVQSLGDAIHIRGKSDVIPISDDHYMFPDKYVTEQMRGQVRSTDIKKDFEVIRKIKIKTFIQGMIPISGRFLGMYYIVSEDVTNMRISYVYYMHIYDTRSKEFVTNLILPLDANKKEVLIKVVPPRKAYSGRNSFTIIIKDENGYRLDTYTVKNLSSSDLLLDKTGIKVQARQIH